MKIMSFIQGYVVGKNKGGEINLQDKTITENGTFTADSGYDGLGMVTVEVESNTSDYNVALADAMMTRDATPLGNEEMLDLKGFVDSGGNTLLNLSSYSFAGFENVTGMRFSDIIFIYDNALKDNIALKTLDITASTSFSTVVFFENAISGCVNLESVILRAGNKLESAGFRAGNVNANDTFYVYVPSEYYDTICANIPSESEIQADRYRKLEDYPEIDHWADVYTVSFYDGDTVVGTAQCKYNGSVTFDYSKEGQTLLGWSATSGGLANSTVLTNITADKAVYAVWLPSGTLDDISWATISEYSRAGTAASQYNVGDSKLIKWTDSDGNINGALATIAGFDLHRNTEGTKDGITWILASRILETIVYSGSVDTLFYDRLGSDLKSVIQQSMISSIRCDGYGEVTTATENTYLFLPEANNIVPFESLLATNGTTTAKQSGYVISQAQNTVDVTLFPLFDSMTLAEIAEFFAMTATGDSFVTRTLMHLHNSVIDIDQGLRIFRNATYTLCKSKTYSDYFTFCFRT